MCYNVRIECILSSFYIYRGAFMSDKICTLVHEYKDDQNVNWKKMYTTMLVAADKALNKIEHSNFAEAAEILQNAMIECEDEYIGKE